MYRFFIPVFGLFYTKVLCPVFFWAFSECSRANMLFCVCFRAWIFVHTLLSLCVCSNSQRNTLNNGSKDQNICVLVEYVTVWTNLSTGGGTKRQQSFLFLRGTKCIGFFWPINVVKMWWRNHVLYGFSEYPTKTSPDNLCFTTLLKEFR